MPLWIREQDALEEEDKMVESGANPRDLTSLSEWRETTDICIQEALNMYGAYLIGQTNGMSDALSLPSVVAAFEIEGTSLEERPAITRYFLMIHSRAMRIFNVRAKHG